MSAWDKVLQHMERRVNPHSFSTWFRPTRQEGSENGKLLIRVPTRMFRKRLTETYGELLQAVLHEIGTPDMRLEFVCTEPETPPASSAQATGSSLAMSNKQSRLDFDSVDHQLNPRYTFDTFVVGASNQFAHAASQAVAERPSESPGQVVRQYDGLAAASDPTDQPRTARPLLGGQPLLLLG